jgi:murein L,D-transpeptidase YafK
MLRIAFSIILPFLILACHGQYSFREEQMSYQRVRNAYAENWSEIDTLLKSKGIEREMLEIYMRAFKREKEFEIWGRNAGDERFIHLLTVPICMLSGSLGPKRQQGDLQIPEGFYHVNAHNPWSNFHLSFCINYPNRSDRILGIQGNLGGNICIHGGCVTIGCIPLTDEIIKPIYILYVEAKNNGQNRPPMTIFPAHLDEETFRVLLENYSENSDKTGLWTDLKAGYDFFEEFNRLPSIEFLEDGRHRIY